MTPDQVAQQLRQELAINERLAELLRAHAKTYADTLYRRTGSLTDHAGLLRLTGAAAGVEDFINSILTAPRSVDRRE